MATFSWRDTAQAIFASCLPCLPSSHPANPEREQAHTARGRDELEGLLQGAEFTDTEQDVDTLSLHSHIGHQDGKKRVRKKHNKNKRSIRLFGYDLFGRPLGSEHPEDEGDLNRRISRISSSTLDSDAAPLADEAIAELSMQISEPPPAEETRTSRKRSRKHQKVAALLDTHGHIFEGFPGSGVMQPPAQDDFGAFQRAPPHVHGEQKQEFVHRHSGGADEADAHADLDAGSYVRSVPERSDSGSSTRWPTSTSSPHSQPRPHLVPLPPSSTGSSTPALSSDANTPALSSAGSAPGSKSKRSKRTKSGRRSTATHSSATTSQPRSPIFVTPAPRVEIVSPHDVPFEGVPMDAENFMTVPPPRRLQAPKITGESVHGEQELLYAIPRPSNHSGNRLGRSSGFPSLGLSRSNDDFSNTGLGGRKRSMNLASHGLSLARTGEDA